jgi:Tol biopolymer transport system component
MRLPIVPFVIAATLLTTVWYFFNATRSGHRTLDVPGLRRLVDIDGIETEVAATPDGDRLAVIASGDLWVLNLSNGTRRQITRTTTDAEAFPNWTPDGKQITFTRGADTYGIDPETGAEGLFRSNATWLSWSQTSRTAFVRDRALWIANPNDQDEKKLVDPDMAADVNIRSPRFSPDSLQIAFIKSQLGIRGEVWVVDTSNGMSRPVVMDRMTENPLDVGWINNGRDLAYLTNRAGAYSVWYVDFASSKINPLTQPLMTVPLARVGMAVAKDHIVLPRHFADSNIVLSDGTTIANSEKLEFQPAASPDGKLFAYTIADDNKFEIWTAGINGGSPIFRTLGREPRFSANGFLIVYSHADLSGNDDIWKLDIRNGSAERVTDAEEIDVAPDWSPDGQSIAFSSGRGGAISIWTIPASGGKRLRLNDGGYAPRYSPDSNSILFWNKQALWTMDSHGNNARQVATDVLDPIAGVWNQSKRGAAFFVKPPGDRLVWPGFDMLRDGRLVFAPIDIRETALWSVDLTYKEK